MQRRSFFKALAGAVCGVVAVLTGKDHVPGVTKKVTTPLDFWDDPAEDVYTIRDGQTIGTTYETGNLNAYLMDGTHAMTANWEESKNCLRTKA